MSPDVYASHSLRAMCNSSTKRVNSFFIPLGDSLPLYLSVVWFVLNPVQFQTMPSIARHTIAFGRLFTLLFFLASSGFTTIMRICTMEACECPDTSGTSDHNACPNEQAPASVASMFIQNVNDCHNAVVGGVAVVQALVEKDSRAQNVEVLSAITSTFVSPASSNTSSCFSYSYSESVSPPSVEKYVLNETFLI